MSDVLAAARALWRAGLSVIPVRRDGSKAPAVPWKEYQSRRATEAELHEWFGMAMPFGIGIVCGAVSGNLIVFDFEDVRSCDRWATAVGEASPGALDNLPVVITPGGGRHVYFRNAGPVPAGAKLAHKMTPTGDLDLALETRGEGHYVIAPGSPADVHEAGVPYQWLRRGWLGSE